MNKREEGGRGGRKCMSEVNLDINFCNLLFAHNTKPTITFKLVFNDHSYNEYNTITSKMLMKVWSTVNS